MPIEHRQLCELLRYRLFFSSSVILLGIFFIQIDGSVWNAHIFDKIIYYKIIHLREISLFFQLYYGLLKFKRMLGR